MKRSTTLLLNECMARMNGYVTLLSYRYMNLPVKAEPASLLPVKVLLGDDEVDFEGAADAAIDGKFKFVVYPKDQLFMESICAGIKLQHPEFKQEIKHMDESENDDDNVLVLTMPEVDDDRYKLITKAVKTLDDECNTKLGATFTLYAASTAADLGDADFKTQEEVSGHLKDIKERFDNERKQYTDLKLKEIEDAHNEFLARKQQKQEEESRKQREEGAETVFNMKME